MPKINLFKYNQNLFVNLLQKFKYSSLVYNLILSLNSSLKYATSDISLFFISSNSLSDIFSRLLIIVGRAGRKPKKLVEIPRADFRLPSSFHELSSTNPVIYPMLWHLSTSEFLRTMLTLQGQILRT